MTAGAKEKHIRRYPWSSGLILCAVCEVLLDSFTPGSGCAWVGGTALAPICVLRFACVAVSTKVALIVPYYIRYASALRAVR